MGSLTAGLSTGHQILDHARQTHFHPVVWMVNAFDSVSFQGLNFFRGDGATTASEDADVFCSVVFEHVYHVL